MPRRDRYVFVCTNRRPDGNPKGSCAQKGSEALKDQLKKTAQARGLDARVRIMTSGCQDLCHLGITVSVWPDGVFYGRVTPADVDEIVDRHLARGEIVERLVIADPDFDPA
jgi:(2Fe-2S) ferredoxin